MKQIEEQNKLLDRIREGDREAVKLLYKDTFHYCASFVIKNNGKLEDARELFQESLFVFIKKTYDPDFQIQHSIKAFLYTVVKNLWLKQLNQKNKGGLDLIVDDPDKNFVLEDIDELEEKKVLEDKHQRLYEGMKLLKEDCRNLLNLTFYKKQSDKEIAPLLGYSLEFVRQKRRRCIKNLKKLMVA